MALGGIAGIHCDAEEASTYLLAAASNICAVVQDSFSYVAVRQGRLQCHGALLLWCIGACDERTHTRSYVCCTCESTCRCRDLTKPCRDIYTYLDNPQCSKNNNGAKCVRALFDRMANSGQAAWCKTIALELVTAAPHVVKHAEATNLLLHVLCHPVLDDKGVMQALTVCAGCLVMVCCTVDGCCAGVRWRGCAAAGRPA